MQEGLQCFQKQSDVSFAARHAWQGLLTSAYLSYQRLLALNHSLTKPPPFLSVGLAEVVSKQPPHLDWLWNIVSPSLAILSLLSLLLWPLSANLSRQPSLVFSNSQPKFSLATRSEPYEIGSQYLVIMFRNMGIYRSKLVTVSGWMWELRCPQLKLKVTLKFHKRIIIMILKEKNKSSNTFSLIVNKLSPAIQKRIVSPILSHCTRKSRSYEMLL